MKNSVQLEGKVIRVFHNEIPKKDGGKTYNHVITLYTEIPNGEWSRKAYIPVIKWVADEKTQALLTENNMIKVEGYLKTYTKEIEVPGGETIKQSVMEVVAETITKVDETVTTKEEALKDL